MTVLYWISFVLLLLTALPSAGCFVAYLTTGTDHWNTLAVRYFRWAVLVVLITFNISIFRHIILIIIHW